MAPSRHNTRLSTVREMDDAFDDDDQDDQEESTPLTRFHPQSSISTAPLLFRGETDASRPNTYDFEREYDFPPPGSPPSPTTSALPNDYGNSNGYLPTSPVIRSSPQSIFRRTFSAILPQSYYQRVPSGRPRGGGTDNDGVFANVTAKPAPLVSVQTDNGDIYIAPEETQQEAPPVRPLILLRAGHMPCANFEIHSSGLYTSVIGFYLVVHGSVSRCRAFLLGHHRAQPNWSGPERRHDHRGVAHGLGAHIRAHYPHIMVLPAAWLHTLLSPAYHACRPIWLTGRPRPHPHPVGVRQLDGHGPISP
jgi:hypothetical protein